MRMQTSLRRLESHTMRRWCGNRPMFCSRSSKATCANGLRCHYRGRSRIDGGGERGSGLSRSNRFQMAPLPRLESTRPSPIVSLSSLPPGNCRSSVSEISANSPRRFVKPFVVVRPEESYCFVCRINASRYFDILGCGEFKIWPQPLFQLHVFFAVSNTTQRNCDLLRRDLKSDLGPIEAHLEIGQISGWQRNRQQR